MNYVEQPDDVVEFSDSHLIFFTNTIKYTSLMSPNDTRSQQLHGSGVIQIPTACRVKFGNTLTYSKKAHLKG